MKNVLSLLFILVSISTAIASISSIEIKGKIISYDADHVKINQNNQTLVLDRALVKAKKIVAGEEISVMMTPEQFNNLANVKKENKK